MGRNVTRGSVPQIMRTVHQYLFNRDEEAEAKSLKAAAYDPKKNPALRDYVIEHGEENADGHIDWLFEEPINTGRATYKGLRSQKSSNTYMDTEKAEELVDKLEIRDRVFKERVVIEPDWDVLYVLNQQGIISDDEIDALMVTEDSYSLVVIK